MSDQIDESGGSAKKVVRIWISQIRSPDDRPLGGITLEQVHGAFSQCGSIEKIICDASSSTAGKPVEFVQVMVQYSRASMAMAAAKTLDGLSLTGDAFHKMRVHPSPYDVLAFGTSSGAPGPGESRSWMTYVPMEDVQKPYLCGMRPDQSLVSRNVIAIRIRNLKTPNLQPLAGFHIHDIHDLCTEFGIVEKVVCFTRQHTNPMIVALVEFAQPDHAVRALCRLQGRSMTNNQYHLLYVQMSRRLQLHVDPKNNLSWDYTDHARLSELRAVPLSDPARRRQDEQGQRPEEGQAHQGRTQVGRVLLVHVTGLEDPSEMPLGGLRPGDLIRRFKAAGPLDKLSVLDRQAGTSFFVLAQFSSLIAAKTAEGKLHGASLTGNDNFKMSVQVSVKQELTTKRIPLNWDFTRQGSRRRQTGLGHQDAPAPPVGCVKLVITSLRWPQKVSMLGGVHVVQVRAACEAFGEVRQVLCKESLEQSAVGLARSLRGVEAIVEFKDAEAAKAAQQLNGTSLTQDKHNVVAVCEAEAGIGRLRQNTARCWGRELPARRPRAAEVRCKGEPVAEGADFGSTRKGAFFVAARRGARSGWPEPLPLRARGFGAEDEELGLEP